MLRVSLIELYSGRVGIGISDCRRNVLCNEACRATRESRSLGLDYRLVQLPRTSSRSSQSCIHHFSDDLGHGRYAHNGRRRAHIRAVREIPHPYNTEAKSYHMLDYPIRRSC